MTKNEINYEVNYLLGTSRKKIKIADFYKNNGKYIFEYVDNAKFEFPGFDLKNKKYISDSFWEQIAARIPNFIRERYKHTPLENLLSITGGALATDSFIFIKID